MGPPAPSRTASGPALLDNDSLLQTQSKRRKCLRWICCGATELKSVRPLALPAYDTLEPWSSASSCNLYQCLACEIVEERTYITSHETIRSIASRLLSDDQTPVVTRTICLSPRQCLSLRMFMRSVQGVLGWHEGRPEYGTGTT